MKNTFILVCLLFSTWIASAQITITPKAGIVFATADIDQEEKGITGYTFGAALTYSLSDRVAIEGGLQFIQKGLRLVQTTMNSGATIKIDQKLKVGYVELPILAKTTFGSQALKFSVSGGFSLGYGLGGKLTVVSIVTGNGINVTESNELKAKFADGNDPEVFYMDNAFDFGLQLGAGVLISERVQIDCRYGVSLTNVIDPAEGTDADSKSRVFQITVGVPLKL
jgi:hypothetical protein